jgi:hypothetical protein
MDRTVKFLLGIIAASLILLNMQLAGVGFVKEAQAQIGALDLDGIETRLEGIKASICNAAGKSPHRDGYARGCN